MPEQTPRRLAPPRRRRERSGNRIIKILGLAVVAVPVLLQGHSCRLPASEAAGVRSTTTLESLFPFIGLRLAQHSDRPTEPGRSQPQTSLGVTRPQEETAAGSVLPDRSKGAAAQLAFEEWLASKETLESVPPAASHPPADQPLQGDPAPKNQTKTASAEEPSPEKRSSLAPDSSILPIGAKRDMVQQATAKPPLAAPLCGVPRIPPSVASQAREYINSGIQLAQRGAIYSARAQFVKVLRLVSQSLDVETRTTRHSTALAAGLRALSEAKQLQPSGSLVEGDVRIDRILRAHRTPVLKQRDPSNHSAIEAVQQYHAYAERQLAKAGGRELVAADALFGLAKLQPHLDLGNDATFKAGPTSMSYYQAALLVYPEHYLAANELGVMFARFGQLPDAREVLRYGAAAAPNFPDLWFNLSQVHQRLGEDELSELAMQEYLALRPSGRRPQPSSANSVPVQWVAPQELAQEGREVGARRSGKLASPQPNESAALRHARQRPSNDHGNEASQGHANKRSSWPFR